MAVAACPVDLTELKCFVVIAYDENFPFAAARDLIHEI